MWYNGAGGDFLTHLLVVDDEVSILELIKNSLGKDGYLITVCQNADDVDIKKLHFYNPPFCERHRRGYETRTLSLVKIVCYTVYGRVRYTTQAVEVSGGVV